MNPRIVLLAGALVLAALPFVAPAANADPLHNTACTGGATPTERCPYLLCVTPTYNQYGDAAYCKYTVYYPCQYCVPVILDSRAQAPSAPAVAANVLA